MKNYYLIIARRYNICEYLCDILEISELKGWEWENLIQITIIPTTVGKNP